MDNLTLTRKKSYANWLRKKKKANGKPYSENTVNSYVSALSTAPGRLIGIKLETTNVFEVTSSSIYREMRLIMEKADNFEDINNKAGNRAFQYALVYYEDFLKDQEDPTMIFEKLDNPFLAAAAELATNLKEPVLLNKNIILYGPPGTGKTYHTALYAVSIIENKPLTAIQQEAEEDGYENIKQRYIKYKEKSQIEFTTFHPSYGYEEFIEGIKPKILSEDETEVEAGEISYEIKSGIFKHFCNTAQTPIIQESNDYGIRPEPTIWKISLGGSGENLIKRDCFNNNRIRIGWDSYGKFVSEETDYRDYGGQMILTRFINEMIIGDIVLVLHDEKTIDAIGVVTGEYDWLEQVEHYKRSRQVRWLVKDIRESIFELNGNKVMTLGSVYRLNRITLADVLAILQKQNKALAPIIQKNENNYVFIIDEINRGNISKIFGELITLIEPVKRIGMTEEIKLRLPYSQESFGVPSNVYILATMNTADRSIARLDTALRRRFYFAEMMPDPGCLPSLVIEGELLNLSEMLSVMNHRIEALYDREHMIGHAYFMDLLSSPSLDKLGNLFEHTIIPLLQEYFYDDYEKIHLVLGDNNKPAQEQFVVVKQVNMRQLFGNTGNIDIDDGIAFEINAGAFNRVESYRKIYNTGSSELG